MQFSQLLKEYRTINGLTQAEMANLISKSGSDLHKISHISYHRWEQGKIVPSLDKQAQVFKELNLVKCLKGISFKAIGKFNQIESYLSSNYRGKYSPEEVYTGTESFISTEAFVSNNSIPDFLLKTQKFLYGTSDPQAFFERILNQDHHKNLLHVYHSEINNSTVGHLFLITTDFTFLNTELISKDANGASIYSHKNDIREVLFVACAYSSSTRIFCEQYMRIVDVLFKCNNVEKVYLRIKDPDLIRVLCNCFKGVVIQKHGCIGDDDFWCGVLLDAFLLKLAYGFFCKSSQKTKIYSCVGCQENRECSLLSCYDKSEFTQTNYFELSDYPEQGIIKRCNVPGALLSLRRIDF